MLRSLLTALAFALLLPATGCDSGDPEPDEVRRIFITEIRIDNAPLEQPDGDDWDSAIGGGPDIYVELVNADTGSIVESYVDENFSNVGRNDFPLIYTLGTDLPEIEFTRFNASLAFDMWDEDPQVTKGDDDFMGTTDAFNLQDALNNNAQTFLTIQGERGISISIRLRYER